MIQINDMSEADRVDRFILGLSDDYRRKVGYAGPNTLNEAKAEANESIHSSQLVRRPTKVDPTITITEIQKRDSAGVMIRDSSKSSTIIDAIITIIEILI